MQSCAIATAMHSDINQLSVKVASHPSSCRAAWFACRSVCADGDSFPSATICCSQASKAVRAWVICSLATVCCCWPPGEYSWTCTPVAFPPNVNTHRGQLPRLLLFLGGGMSSLPSGPWPPPRIVPSATPSFGSHRGNRRVGHGSVQFINPSWF